MPFITTLPKICRKSTNLLNCSVEITKTLQTNDTKCAENFMKFAILVSHVCLWKFKLFARFENCLIYTVHPWARCCKCPYFCKNPKAFPSLHVASLHRIFLCKHHHHINLNQRQCSHDHHDQHDHHEHDEHDHQGHSGGFEQSGICGHSDRGGEGGQNDLQKLS